MESNKRAIRILLILVLSAVSIFFLEATFLKKELRGETLSKYDKVIWKDKILLLVDDFEGLKGDDAFLKKENFFGYGSVSIGPDSSQNDKNPVALKTSLKAEWNGKEGYGGWGKGIGKNVDLNASTDYLNFRIFIPNTDGYEESMRVTFEEDDNNDGILQQEKDDSWFCQVKFNCTENWAFLSIPLKDFKDGNAGGDSILNVSRKGGLHNMIFAFDQVDKYKVNHKWYFDFICFTNGKVTDIETKK